MKIKKDLHVHTTYCDGKSTPEEIVLAAINLGLDALGFSGHSYTFFDETWCMSREGTNQYIDEIHSLKEKYSQDIEILCGTEQDFYSDASVEAYDYFIGSVHYIRIPKENRPLIEGCLEYADFIYIPIDESADIQKNAADAYFGGDIYALAAKYFETVSGWADKNIRPAFIGHFDLITKFIEKTPLFDTGNPRYVSAWKAAADKLFAAGFVFEINTGAISRGYRTAPYPSFEIQDYIAQNGGRFIMSSDSHHKNTLMYKFDEFERSSYSNGNL